jgi:hypothetical protein
MATTTLLEEPAALAKRIEDFASAIERPMIAGPAARLAGYQGRHLVGNAPATVAIADAWCSSSTATQTCHYSLQRHRTSSCARLAPMSALNRMPRDTRSP